MFSYTEKLIVNNENSSIEVKHLILKGSNYEIGKKLAEIGKERHNVKKYNSNKSINQCENLYISKNYPIYFQKMKGAAEAYDMDIHDNSVDFTLFGRTPLESGCSAVFYPSNMTSNNHNIICRNLDFPANGKLSNPYIVELHPDEGYSSLFMFSYELLGISLEGINSEGLIVVHLADSESRENYDVEPTLNNSVGLNEFLSIQLLLDTCSNAMEAKQALLINKHFYMFQPVHLLVADRYGNSFVWEYSHNHNKEFIIDGDNRPQVVTNFLLNRYKSLEDLPKITDEKCCSYNRFRVLHDCVKSKNDCSLDFIKETNKKVFFNAISCNNQTITRTIWNSIFDANDRSMEISFYLGEFMNDSSTQEKQSIYSDYYKIYI